MDMEDASLGLTAGASHKRKNFASSSSSARGMMAITAAMDLTDAAHRLSAVPASRRRELVVRMVARASALRTASSSSSSGGGGGVSSDLSAVTVSASDAASALLATVRAGGWNDSKILHLIDDAVFTLAARSNASTNARAAAAAAAAAATSSSSSSSSSTDFARAFLTQWKAHVEKHVLVPGNQQRSSSALLRLLRLSIIAICGACVTPASSASAPAAASANAPADAKKKAQKAAARKAFETACRLKRAEQQQKQQHQPQQQQVLVDEGGRELLSFASEMFLYSAAPEALPERLVRAEGNGSLLSSIVALQCQLIDAAFASTLTRY